MCPPPLLGAVPGSQRRSGDNWAELSRVGSFWVRAQHCLCTDLVNIKQSTLIFVFLCCSLSQSRSGKREKQKCDSYLSRQYFVTTTQSPEEHVTVYGHKWLCLWVCSPVMEPIRRLDQRNIHDNGYNGPPYLDNTRHMLTAIRSDQIE